MHAFSIFYDLHFFVKIYSKLHTMVLSMYYKFLSFVSNLDGQINLQIYVYPIPLIID